MPSPFAGCDPNRIDWVLISCRREKRNWPFVGWPGWPQLWLFPWRRRPSWRRPSLSWDGPWLRPFSRRPFRRRRRGCAPAGTRTRTAAPRTSRVSVQDNRCVTSGFSSRPRMTHTVECFTTTASVFFLLVPREINTKKMFQMVSIVKPKTK